MYANTCEKADKETVLRPEYWVGTCESAVFVRIESRVESGVKIRIRIESRIESAVGPQRGTARRTTAVGTAAFWRATLVSALVSGGVVEAANDVSSAGSFAGIGGQANESN